MLRPAFSTVACPTWTLERVAAAAEAWGYLGVELRTFGQGATQFACDPALTDGAKVRRVLSEAGVEAAGLATGCRFDAPIFPPVIGQIFTSREKTVHEANHMIDVARDCGGGSIRVFGFEAPRGERRAATLKRVSQRLWRVCDYARNRGVIVLVENGGSFSRAADLVELIEAVNSPLLGAIYDGVTAQQAGDDVREGAALLGARLRAVRLRDVRDNRPARLGTGEAPCRELVEAVRDTDQTWGLDPWVIYTWDRAWLPELAPAEEVLPEAAQTIARWSGQSLGQRRRYEARQSAAPAMMLESAPGL